MTTNPSALDAVTSHSPASSPELPKLPDLPLAYYAADHVRAYATSYGLACYEAGRASHAAPTVPVDAVAKDVAERVVKAIEQAYNDTEQSVPRDFCGEATDAAYGAVMDALAATPASPQAPAPQAVVGEAMREFLGKLVRTEWVAWAAEQENPKPSWLLSWDDLTEPEREVDRRIGERLWRFGYVRTAPSAAPHQGADALREALTEQLKIVAELLDQMHHFAKADQRLWDEGQRDLESFKSWVRSRAAHLLAKFTDRAALAHHQAPQQGEQHE